MAEKITVGASFSASEEVDRYRAVYYAGASGDFNPIHIDPEFGRMVGLGGVILHGLCAMAFAAKAVTDWTGDPGKLKKLRCRFAAPVHIGDVLTVSGQVTEVSGKRATVALKVVRQDGDEVERNVSAEVEV